jgi:predicted MFS family arabinose efflux permease
VGAPPLRRNRDFLLLQAGQLLSTAGTQATTIAYPLLVLALTGSPAQAGVVTFARLVPAAVLALPAGLAADRYDRRRLMIAADAARAVALAALAATILAGHVAYWEIPVVAFLEGAGATVFIAAQAGALRAVMHPSQLPAAVGAQEARDSVVRLGGPPLGGLLFELGRAVPFLVDAVSYAASIASLWAMRTPFQQAREPDPAGLRAQIAEGFRFLWSRPFLRACAFLFAFGNFTLPGIFLVIVVVGRGQGLGGGAIGLLLATFGAATLLGSLVSPLMRRAFSMRAIVWIELWVSLTIVAFLVWPSVYVLTAAILPQALVIPVTNSVVVGYRVAVTPDRLLGRVETVRSTISLLIAPLGPLVAGLLLGATSARETVAVFAAFSAILLVGGMLSPAIRHAPSLAELRAVEVT